MRDLEQYPPLPDGLHVTFTSVSGIAVKPFADGYATMRVCLGQMEFEPDGLLTEMADTALYGTEPIPWASKTTRDEAVASIQSRKHLDVDVQDDLIRHILQTPYYESD